MTKQEFLEGVRFRLPGSTLVEGVGSIDYNLRIGGGTDIKSIEKNYVSGLTGKVIIVDAEANVSDITRVGFKAYSFVMGKKVEVSYKFKDLIKIENGHAK